MHMRVMPTVDDATEYRYVQRNQLSKAMFTSRAAPESQQDRRPATGPVIGAADQNPMQPPCTTSAPEQQQRGVL